MHARGTRRQVVEDAIDLLTAGDTREISAVLANRHRMTERQVDRYLVAALAGLQRAYSNLEIGVANAVLLAKEAGQETEDEVLA